MVRRVNPRYIEELDANNHFLDALEKERKRINEIIANPTSMTMTKTDVTNFKESKQCWICEKPFYGKDKNRKVRDHCHFTGKYRGAAHSYCNLGLSVEPGKTIIPIIFHNLQTSGVLIREYVGLRPKMYSVLLNVKTSKKKAKGVTKSVLKKEILHQKYKEVFI